MAPPPGMMAPMLYKDATVEEAAKFWGVSVATIRRWCAAGKVPARRHGRAWVIDLSQVPICRLCRRPYFDQEHEVITMEG